MFSKAGCYNTYVYGFVNGVQYALEKQSQELMVVVPLAVREEFEEVAKGFSKARSRKINTSRDESDYNAGYEDGIDAVNSTRINATDTAYILGA